MRPAIFRPHQLAHWRDELAVNLLGRPPNSN
jgi:hypothetical protein